MSQHWPKDGARMPETDLGRTPTRSLVAFVLVSSYSALPRVLPDRPGYRAQAPTRQGKPDKFEQHTTWHARG